MHSSTNSYTPKIVGTVAIGSIVTAGAFVFLHSAEKPSTSAKTTTTQATAQSATNTTTAQPASSTSATSPSTSKTYSETVSYNVPRETNDITVSVTVQDGIITSVDTAHNYIDHESGSYINSFEKGVKSAVVGKSISSVSATRIGGASLTSQAFYEALRSIANQVS